MVGEVDWMDGNQSQEEARIARRCTKLLLRVGFDRPAVERGTEAHAWNGNCSARKRDFGAQKENSLAGLHYSSGGGVRTVRSSGRYRAVGRWLVEGG